MKKYLLLILVLLNSLILKAQDCPSITGWIKTTSNTSLGTCDANVIANASTQSIFSGETIAINLSSSKPGTTFSWTFAQLGVTGASSGSGTAINQILNNVRTVDGTVTYTITPKLGSCTGTPVTVVITVKPLFKNVLKSGTFTKNNCASGGTGSTITYTVPAGTYSESSQTAADQKAQNDINANGQNYANANGSCTFTNIAVSGTFTRNNCGTGGTGSSVVYTIAAGTQSASSQAAANAIAQNLVNSNGQAYANTNGYCTYSSTRSGNFTRNNCPSGRTGSVVSFSAQATSNTSQADADARALAAVNAGGQANANALGTCTLPTKSFYYQGRFPQDDPSERYRTSSVRYIDKDGVERTFNVGAFENGCRPIIAASIVSTSGVLVCGN